MSKRTACSFCGRPGALWRGPRALICRVCVSRLERQSQQLAQALASPALRSTTDMRDVDELLADACAAEREACAQLVMAAAADAPCEVETERLWDLADRMRARSAATVGGGA